MQKSMGNSYVVNMLANNIHLVNHVHIVQMLAVYSLWQWEHVMTYMLLSKTVMTITVTINTFYLGTWNNIKNCIIKETIVLIMLVNNTRVCPGDLIIANYAAITRPPTTHLQYHKHSQMFRSRCVINIIILHSYCTVNIRKYVILVCIRCLQKQIKLMQKQIIPNIIWAANTFFRRCIPEQNTNLRTYIWAV